MRILFGVMVWGLSAVASAQGEDLKQAVAKLSAKDYRARNEAYQVLRRARSPEVLPLLERAIPGLPAYSQSLAVSVLQSYPRDQAEPVMRRLLRSESPFLVLTAAVWLRQGGDSRVEKEIVRALGGSRSQNELNMMLNRLHGVDSPAVNEAVLAQVNPEASEAVLQGALRYLLRNKHRAAVPVVVGVVDGIPADAPGERAALCTAFLVAMGDRSRIETLATAIRGMNNLSRIQEFLNATPSLDRKILEAILEYADDKQGSQVTVALRILAQHDYTPAVRRMRDLLEDEDKNVAKAAFDGLMRMSSGLQPKFLRGLLASERAAVVVAAADALRRIDDVSGLPRLVALAGKPGQRLEVIRALGKFRARAAVEPLLRAMEDPDRNVRDAAERGLQSVFRGLFPYRTISFVAAGYKVDGPAAARGEAVATIRHWWKLANGGR